MWANPQEITEAKFLEDPAEVGVSDTEEGANLEQAIGQAVPQPHVSMFAKIWGILEGAVRISSKPIIAPLEWYAAYYQEHVCINISARPMNWACHNYLQSSKTPREVCSPPGHSLNYCIKNHITIDTVHRTFKCLWNDIHPINSSSIMGQLTVAPGTTPSCTISRSVHQRECIDNFEQEFRHVQEQIQQKTVSNLSKHRYHQVNILFCLFIHNFFKTESKLFLICSLLKNHQKNTYSSSAFLFLAFLKSALQNQPAFKKASLF